MDGIKLTPKQQSAVRDCADALHQQSDISPAELQALWDDQRPIIDYQAMMAAYREDIM